MGATRTEGAGVLLGLRKERGGRDRVGCRFSSVGLEACVASDFGRMSSRWPCAHSFVVASPLESRDVWRREVRKCAPDADSEPLEPRDDAGARRCCGLVLVVAAVAVGASSGGGESGKEAGRVVVVFAGAGAGAVVVGDRAS
jgi:hypothetical protein